MYNSLLSQVQVEEIYDENLAEANEYFSAIDRPFTEEEALEQEMEFLEEVKNFF